AGEAPPEGDVPQAEPATAERPAEEGAAPEADAPADAPAAAPAAAPRAPARDPFAEALPRSLSRAARAVASGREVSTRYDKGLMQYARAHRGDARPQILLARAYLSRGWRSDAIERYGLAYREDPSSRGAPSMQ